MRTLFISDLHLSAERPDIIKLFTRFMENEAQHSQALYILGDLFEVWLGDDFIPDELEVVIDSLKNYTNANHELYVLHGNRDFLLGERFEALTGCKILPDPSLIELNQTKTLISHGDELCIDDVDYMAFRKQVRNEQWQQEFLAKPIEERIAFAKHARQESIKQTQQKELEIMDVNQGAVEQLMQEYDVNCLIHGHTHRPNTHRFQINQQPVTRIVLGDWYQQGSVLSCDDQGCTLSTLPL